MEFRTLEMTAKPDWLRIPYQNNHNNAFVTELLKELGLNTVCVEANCPNCSECFSKKTATFLILGKNCTRNCSFCNITNDTPLPVDEDEPDRIAEAAVKLDLHYVVITSVTRDDLKDGGAGHFANVTRAIRRAAPETTIELLIPDLVDLKVVTNESPAVISHNIETVESLYTAVRPEANYDRSLDVLRNIKHLDPGIYTKSGIMLGLGETREEVLKTFDDLLDAGCDYLTIGQYLPPTKKHYRVREYIEPEVFGEYAKTAEKKGFRHVFSGPFVRSSYNAEKALSSHTYLK